jgi:hypothetical protein
MKTIMFILNNKIIKRNENDLTISQIEIEKLRLSFLHKCRPEDIDVLFEDSNYSDYDIGVNGMHDWRDAIPHTISGVRLNLKLGSNVHLDAILNNEIEKYLIFV